MGLTVVAPLSDVAGPISSSRIRRALQDGYPERAAALLGRDWCDRPACVFRGDQRGRTLGFPTANIMPLGRHLEPARGVYADAGAHCRAATAMPGSLISAAGRPSAAIRRARLEVHLFDFDADLYDADALRGARCTLFCAPEQRFAGLEALRAQIAGGCGGRRGSCSGHQRGRSLRA